MGDLSFCSSGEVLFPVLVARHRILTETGVSGHVDACIRAGSLADKPASDTSVRGPVPVRNIAET